MQNITSTKVEKIVYNIGNYNFIVRKYGNNISTEIKENENDKVKEIVHNITNNTIGYKDNFSTEEIVYNIDNYNIIVKKCKDNVSTEVKVEETVYNIDNYTIINKKCGDNVSIEIKEKR